MFKKKECYRVTSFRIEEEKRLNLAALEPPRKHPHQPLCKTNRKAWPQRVWRREFRISQRL